MKTTLSVSIDEDLDAAIRAEVERQRRPLSWVVEDALRNGLPKHPSKRAPIVPSATTDAGART